MSNEELFSLEDQRLINLNQKTRESIIIHHTKEGRLPDTEEDQMFLINAMKGIDDSIFKRVKLKTDKETNQTNQQISASIADILKQVSAGPNGKVRDAVPKLDNTFTINDPVPGETDIGSITITQDDVIAK